MTRRLLSAGGGWPTVLATCAANVMPGVAMMRTACYDAENRMISETDVNGTIATYAYDGSWHRVRESTADTTYPSQSTKKKEKADIEIYYEGQPSCPGTGRAATMTSGMMSLGLTVLLSVAARSCNLSDQPMFLKHRRPANVPSDAALVDQPKGGLWQRCILDAGANPNRCEIYNS